MTTSGRFQYSLGQIITIMLLASAALACFVVSPPFFYSHEKQPEKLWISWMGFGLIGSAIGLFFPNGVAIGVTIGVSLGIVYAFVIVGMIPIAVVAGLVGAIVVYGIATH